MRALAKAIGKAVGFAVFAAIVIALYMTGANVYGYFAGPWTPVDQSQAAMAKLADATLYPHSLREIRALLGEPEHVECSSGEINLDEYRWYRGAIRERAAGDIPIRVEIDDSGWFDILPFGRPNFPGTFLDLKIGGPAPSPEATAACVNARSSAAKPRCSNKVKAAAASAGSITSARCCACPAISLWPPATAIFRGSSRPTAQAPA